MRFVLRLLALLPAVFAAPIEQRASDDLIADQWIVKIPASAQVDTVIESITNILGLDELSVRRQYSFGDFKGFAFNAAVPALLVETIGALAHVDLIEQDRKMFVNALTSENPAPSYGLARISSRNRGSPDYLFDSSAGTGTFAYIIDTGIRVTHSDFGGRATFGANFAGDGLNTDGNGHGTHVAGTTAGSKFGVAKKASLIAVKVLGSDGSGAVSNIISGINFAVNDASNKGRIGKAVANMSLGGGFSSALNQAANQAVTNGLFLAVAAGNSNQDASNFSPASAASVCTVGAIEETDTRASYSNFGSVVDIFAPGSDITSDWNGSDSDTNTISGTSMATPHITGLGAYILAIEGPSSGTALCNRIRQLATSNVVANAGTGSPNLLAYNGNGQR